LKTIGIIGSRRRNNTQDYSLVEQTLESIYESGDILVSGGCSKGGDHFAEILAARFNIPIKIYKANWKQGKHAGFLRNTDIARDADVLIACVANDRKGGTEDTIRKFNSFHPDGRIILVF